MAKRTSDGCCSVEGCGRPIRARSWCTGHYQRWYLTGDLGSAPIRERTPNSPPASNGKKWCRSCQIVKPITEFGANKQNRDGLTGWCKHCDARRVNEWNKAHIRQTYGAHIKRTYGITLDDYEAMLEAQNGICAVCQTPGRTLDRGGKPKRLEIHHDHKSGKVIALLCWQCNTGMGKFGDDPELLRRAALLQERAPAWTS